MQPSQGAKLTGLHALAGSHTAAARPAAPVAAPAPAHDDDAAPGDMAPPVMLCGVVVARPPARG